MNFHQKSQTRKYAMNSYGFLGASGGRNRKYRKSATPNQYFGTFWQKSPYTTPVTVILGQNGAKWRKSALFAKKCTFGPFGLPGGLQNHYVYPYFWPGAPLGPILAKTCTF